MRRLVRFVLIAAFSAGCNKSATPSPAPAPAAPASCPPAAACPAPAECPKCEVAGAVAAVVAEVAAAPVPAPVVVAPAVAVDVDVSAPGIKAAHARLLDLLPAGTVVAVTLDIGRLIRVITEQRLGFVPATGEAGGLRKALGEASRKDFGVDLLAAGTATGWVALAQKAFGIWIEGPFEGALKLGDLPTVDAGGISAVQLDTDVFAALVEGRLVVANRAGLDLSHGTGPKLATDTSLRAAHAKGLEVVDDGVLVASGGVPAEFAAKLPVPGLEAFALAVGPMLNMTAALFGQEESLDKLAQLVATARDPMLAELRAGMAALTELTFPGSSMAVVYGQAVLADFEQYQWVTKKGPNTLTASFAGITAASGGAALMGTLAAVAVPAFIKYQARAKTVEAINNLDRIYKGAATYFVLPRVNKDGSKAPCEFPPASVVTPPTEDGLCCGGARDADKDSRCDPAVTDWESPTWTALGFAVSDPHRFHYGFKSSGTGADAKFTAVAYGDLDCDGVFSTFERSATADPSSGTGECAMAGSSALFKDLETE